MRRLQSVGILCLLFSLVICALGGWLTQRHRLQSRDEAAIAKLDGYIAEKMRLDTELYDQSLALRRLQASVKGTVALMFDQCAPNAYEVAFEWVSAYEMTGSLVFRDLLPGQEGALAQAQWKEMQDKGWSAVLASPDSLLATLKQPGYTERLADYVEKMVTAFEEMGFSLPRAYSFAEGECNEELLTALTKKGFVAFTAPDVQTVPVGEEAFLIQELYLKGDENAQLLQPLINEIRNKADGFVIKTRYVDDGGDMQKDTTLAKLRRGVLPSLAAYRKDESVAVATVESAAKACGQQWQIYSDLEAQRQETSARMEAIRADMAALWQSYCLG